MQFADDSGGAIVDLGSRPVEDTLRRDLRLTIEQKKHADRLVDNLTKRCDALRLTILKERKETKQRISQLEEKCEKEVAANRRLNDELAETRAQVQSLQQKLADETSRVQEFKSIAEASLKEATEALNELALLKNNG